MRSIVGPKRTRGLSRIPTPGWTENLITSTMRIATVGSPPTILDNHLTDGEPACRFDEPADGMYDDSTLCRAAWGSIRARLVVTIVPRNSFSR